MSIKVWCDSVYGTLIAKTKGTFDAVATNASNVIISKRDAESLLGFLVTYAMGVTTDAENMPDLFIEINSKALGISNEVICIPAGGNDADANNEYTPMITQFVPFKLKPGFADKLFNATISFKASPSITNTGGIEVGIGVIYADAEPDLQFAMELMAQMVGRVTGGDAKGDAALAHTGAAFSTLTSLTIPAGTSVLRGLLGKINPNGITAGDPVMGLIEFIAPGISDFSPQLWPLCIAWNAALGTVAESASYSAPGRYYPTRFPLPGAEVTVQAKTIISISAATAPDTTQALLYE